MWFVKMSKVINQFEGEREWVCVWFSSFFPFKRRKREQKHQSKKFVFLCSFNILLLHLRSSSILNWNVFVCVCVWFLAININISLFCCIFFFISLKFCLAFFFHSELHNFRFVLLFLRLLYFILFHFILFKKIKIKKIKFDNIAY